MVCHVAGETEAQRWGGLPGRGSVGRPLGLQAQDGAAEHPGQVQEVVLFVPPPRPCHSESGGWVVTRQGDGGGGHILVGGRRGLGRGASSVESKSKAWAGRGARASRCTGMWGWAWVLMGRVMLPRAPTGVHVPQDSGCSGHVSSGARLPPALSKRWHFPPKLESTPRLKLISLPLHNNNCSASP